MDQWKNSFKNCGNDIKPTENILKPFAILSSIIKREVAPNQLIDKSSIGTSTIRHLDNLDLLSCQVSLS